MKAIRCRFILKRLTGVLPVLFAFCSDCSAANEPSSEGGVYQDLVFPFLKQHCFKCHGENPRDGQTSFTRLNTTVDAENGRIWADIYLRLLVGDMPPRSEPTVDVTQRSRVSNWIRTELLDAPQAGFTALSVSGNKVPHSLLFGSRPATPSYSPAVIWRIRPQVYRRMIAEVAGGAVPGVVAPFPYAAPDTEFGDYAAAHIVDGAALDVMLRNCEAIATRMTSVELRRGRLVSSSAETLDEIASVLDPMDARPMEERIRIAVIAHFRRVLLRDPTDEECNRLVEFTHQGIERFGPVRAVRNMISAILLMPEAIYRFEVGHGEPDEHGRLMRPPRDLAFAIAYALTDSRPDKKLLDAIATGRLSSRDGVRAQVRRILLDDAISRPRILQFFREYFEYDHAIDVFKDSDLFVHHNAAALVNDTDLLILSILQQDRDVLKNLLTTSKGFVNCFSSGSGHLRRASGQYVHLSYNLPHNWTWSAEQPVALPQGQRAGVLSQPSWLVAHSGNFENSPVRRGRWIREKLLGQSVQEIPLTVDAQLPDNESLSLRQKLTVTMEEDCWSCHRDMNPLGLPFEQYDHFGRWRSTELQQPVLTDGAVRDSGDDQLDGTVQSPVELVQQLAASNYVRQVFVRYAFRYWLGRDETIVDAASLQRADRDYRRNNGSMRALITSLLTSDSFLYRKTHSGMASSSVLVMP